MFAAKVALSQSYVGPIYTTTGNHSWQPPIGSSGVWFVLWGGGGAGGSVRGGGGSPCVVSSQINIDGGTSPINIYVGRGGKNNGNDSSDGEHSTVTLPSGQVIVSGYGRSDGSSFRNTTNDGATVNFGGTGGLNCTSFLAGGGGGGSAYFGFVGNGGLPECNFFVSSFGGGAGGQGAGIGGKGTVFISTRNDSTVHGGNPGGGGGGLSNGSIQTTGGNGRVDVGYILDGGTPGIIAQPYSVPFPRESSRDSIRSIKQASGYNPGGNSILYRWEYSTNSVNWFRVPGINTGASFKIPENDSVGYYYRRIAINVPYADTISNFVKLKVFRNDNVVNGLPSKNGSIFGRVVSRSGAGVAGIKVYAKKTIDLKSSPASHIDSAITGSSGQYRFVNLYYGDKDAPNNDPVSVSFNVWPSEPLHKFDPDTLLATLSYDYYSHLQSLDFTDTTVLSITGRIFQKCNGCLNQNNIAVDTITAGVDSAKITGGDIPVYSRTNGSGIYEASVQNPGSKTFVPSFLNHQFFPAFKTIIVNNNVSDQHFEDTTTRTISGRLTAGGGDAIGTAELEFTDTVKGRSGYTFRKRVNVNTNGTYSIRLPARSYRVKVISFTSNYDVNNPRYLSENEVGVFFNFLVPKDSLISNVDSADKILNLVYRRRPFIRANALVDTTCNSTAGVVFFQNKRKPFSIEVFEGNPVIGTRVFTLDNEQSASNLSVGDSVTMITDLLDQNGNGPDQTFKMRLLGGVADTAITAGVPNIVAPFNRRLMFSYTDRYGRIDTLIKKTTTVGILSPPQTFVTVAPEVPQLILHRPPGDESYSFWEQTKTVETVQRLSLATGAGLDAFAEIKVGAEFSLGIGVQVQTRIEGSINNSISTSSTNISENELLFSNSTTSKYSTRAGGIPGSSGDVYIGGAMNYKYGVSSVLALLNQNGTCPLDLSDKLIVAPKGYATTFTYSEDHIKNTLMPALNLFVANTTGPQQAYYQNQLNVWQQVIDNNAYQKANAEFVENRSFDGAAGGVEISRTFTKSGVNTVSYNLEISNEVAMSVGAEVNGTGINGGVTVNVRSESGKSLQNTITTETTTGYLLADANAGDYYSVDIKRDKVYGTPVFDLVAGTSSCPPEPGAQSRDFPRIIIDTPVYNNIPVSAEHFFKIKVVNLSQSREVRNYQLNVNNATSNGLIITANGQVLGGALTYPINDLPYNEPREIDLSVRRSNPNGSEFSWSDVEFTLTDDCGGEVEATNYVSFNFVTACSGIVMDEPADNWRSSISDQSIIPVGFSGYNSALIDSVVVQYARSGTNAWKRGMVVPGFLITNPTNTQVPWNVSTLPDSIYKVRLQMYCSGGVKFTTPSVTGVLDRSVPRKTGKPQPADDVFSDGDEISFTYNEILNADSLGGITVSLFKQAEGHTSPPISIPASFSIFDKKLTVVPLLNIADSSGADFMVVIAGIRDAIGNTNNTPDTSYFRISGTAAPVVAPPVQVFAANAARYEDSAATLSIRFTLPSNAARLTKLFYSVSGTANFEEDYTVATDTIQRLVRDRQTNALVPLPVYSYFNGSSGYIYIDSLARQAVLRIRPVADKVSEGNETVRITLLSGGDYAVGDTSNALVTILNDDASKPGIEPNGPLALCGDSIWLTATSSGAVQFATKVLGYSSQLSNTAGAAVNVLGQPDVFPAYGDAPGAWTPATPDNAREFIEIGFANPAPINFIDVYETYKPGSIDTVYIRNPNTGLYEIVYAQPVVSQPEVARKMHISFPTTSFAVGQIRLAMASGAVAGKNEIDAVAIGDSTPYVQYLWTPSGATTSGIWVKTPGSYAVSVTDVNGNKAYSDTVKVITGSVGTLQVGPALPAICPGSSSIELGGTFSGDITAAIWTDGGAGGQFVNNNGTNPGAAVYTAAHTANGVITLQLNASGGCALPVTKTILVNGETTWLGLTNNWNADSNWSLGKVPFSCTVVHVPAATPNAPVISGTGNTCKLLDVKPGTTVVLSQNATLQVTGH